MEVIWGSRYQLQIAESGQLAQSFVQDLPELLREIIEKMNRKGCKIVEVTNLLDGFL